MSPEHDASVMIVEDERVSRKALASLLAGQGYNIKAFESAEDLLAEVDRGTEPLAVLADVDLPGMSGLELLSHLERKYPDLYAVLITAADGERIDRFCREHPCAYLRKPLNFAQLLSLLDQSKNDV